MEAQEPEYQTQVIPFAAELRTRLWPVERIGGVKMNLGRMSLDELLTAESHCYSREEDARMDRLIIRDHIDARFTPEVEGY